VVIVVSKRKSGTIQEGLLDKEFESFMGLDKQRNEKDKISFDKYRTDEEKLRAYKMMWRRTFHFKGYSAKCEYWWGMLLTNSFLILTALVALLLYQLTYGVFLLVSPVLAIFGLIFICANISALTRRLADTGHHRLFGIIPFILAPPLFFLPWGWLINSMLVIMVVVFVMLLALKPTDETVRSTVQTLTKDFVDKNIFSE